MNEPLPVSDPVAQMEQELRRHGRAEGTIANYKSIGREFIRIVGPKKKYGVDDLNRYLDTLIVRKKQHGHMEDERKTGSYMRFLHFALASLYKANKWEWYPDTVAFKQALPKLNEPKTPWYTMEEIAKIIEAAKAEAELSQSGLRDYLILRVEGIAFSRRVSQIRLRRWDYDPKTETIKMPQVKGGKPQNPKLDPETNALMLKYLKSRTDEYQALFASQRNRDMTGYLRPDHINVMLKRLCEKAGVEYKGTHALRRGWITDFAAKHGERPTFEMTDHKSYEMVLRYMQLAPGYADDQRAQSHPFWVGAPPESKRQPVIEGPEESPRKRRIRLGRPTPKDLSDLNHV